MEVNKTHEFLLKNFRLNWSAHEIWERKLDKSRFDEKYIETCLEMLYREGIVSKTSGTVARYRIKFSGFWN